MSRFVEVLNLYRNEFSIRNVAKILAEMKARLDAGSAHIEFTFPYFIKKAAPVSGLEALMEYGCRVHAMASTGVETVLEVSAPITTLCPCSKEISRAGAHNQRGTATVAVTFKNFVWIEDMVAVMEGSASCETYALLKREDEAFVTERAYDNPKFVEDVVRDMATKLMKNPDITWFSASAEAQESIHNHNAYAQVEREKTEGARPAWWRYHVR
jgi:GTP cyclohydrolase I